MLGALLEDSEALIGKMLNPAASATAADRDGARGLPVTRSGFVLMPACSRIGPEREQAGCLAQVVLRRGRGADAGCTRHPTKLVQP